jgi:hypothetical protein
MWRTVFEDDDGVIDNEADEDERHHGEVVEAVSHKYMTRRCR